MEKRMNITLNGLPEQVAATTVAGLIALKAWPIQGVAVAVNGEIVQSATWPETPLTDGDVVDIVTAKQGG